MNNYLAGSIFIVWLGVTCAAFYWFASDNLVEFDPNAQLATVLASPQAKLNYEAQLKSNLKLSYATLANQVFQLESKHCRCNQAVTTHLATLTPWLTQKGFNINKLDYDVLKQQIPASPAIIIFDENEDLVYLGPFASGYLCNTENSMIELTVKSALEFKQVPRVIFDNAQGCYCYS
ncbi:DUF6436 domain-containing protein [Catenovulum sp. 2E275]|uniref:DUF6436 domain-containing protein n=1 Tax=Catenovulum sp. 2E275 TaxID=2980497 RepID=UPI0021D0F089|nr:DUF6436 domain-containing protein [Catenovulum sp. 2E275]MCU4677608.1 DUF6436 domain-containing protein [Catenovulum sp. 2E275]